MEKIETIVVEERRKISFLVSSGFLFAALCLVFSIFTSTSLHAGSNEILDNAAVLLQEKKSESAYRLLEKHEDDYAGWWEYDYLLGVAALESGKANLAIFALQRAMAMNPKLAGAHVDLGRAYYEVRDYVPAKKEFETVLLKRPNQIVEKVARRYLKLIDRKIHSSRPVSRYYLETVAGYDSNANSATDEKFFNGFELSAENIKTASTFLSFKTGASLRGRVNSKNAYHVALNFRQRRNQQMESVSFSNMAVQGAWSRHSKSLVQTIGAQVGKTNISDSIESYTASTSIGLKYGRGDSDVRLNGNFSTTRFSGELAIRNSSQIMFGLSLQKKHIKSFFSLISLSTLLGKNIPKDSQSSNEKIMAGGRLVIQKKWMISIPIEISLSSGLMYSKYKEDQFGLIRKDVLTDVGVSLLNRPRKLWEIFYRSTLMKNSSGIELYNYTRVNNAVGVKKIF